jgi:hypothetical protein
MGYPSKKYSKLSCDVLGQERLARYWYSEARLAMEAGNLAVAVEMQKRAAFRSKCSRTCRDEWIATHGKKPS